MVRHLRYIQQHKPTDLCLAIVGKTPCPLAIQRHGVKPPTSTGSVWPASELTSQPQYFVEEGTSDSGNRPD